MKKTIYLLLLVIICACSKAPLMYENINELSDNDLTSYFAVLGSSAELVFASNTDKPVLMYKLWSASQPQKYDPDSWTLKGSNDNEKWVTLDEQDHVTFCSRFQENLYELAAPANFKYYKLTVKNSFSDTIYLSEVKFDASNEMTDWHDFNYPEVNFEDLAEDTKGSELYRDMVQIPDDYIQYHALKVAQILYFSDTDEMYDVQKVNYTLKDYEGVSAKGGQPPVISIVYSTQHVEKSSAESFFKLDYETRGVLYHELVHAYQQEPKGIGSYSTNKTFWACIEGVADAVRAHAGYFDIKVLRKPGGNWMDGYKTTGFFIQWLTTKDPDAIRKFNATARELEVWSFDGAIKSIFGNEHSIEQMWNEYQEYLLNQNN